MRVLMITNKVKTYALGFQNVLEPLRELGHEVVWAADFSNFVGDKSFIPCVVEHISINTNPLNPTNRTALKQVCKIIKKYDIQAIQCLGVNTDNKPAIRAYTKAGFAVTGEKKYLRVLRKNIPYHVL